MNCMRARGREREERERVRERHNDCYIYMETTGLESKSGREKEDESE